MGWYTMPQGGERVSDPLLVEDSMMLFAYWKQNQEGVVENVTIAGSDSEILSVWYDEVSTPVDFSKVEYEYQDENETFGVLGYVVENVTIAGSDSEILSVWYDEVSTPVDFSKVEYEYQDENETFGVLGYDRYPEKCAQMTIKAYKRGTVRVFAKYNGKVIKTWNVTVTSDWQEYLGYVSWRKGVESQIWNNSMNVTQKLDAARDYIRTNFKYGHGGAKIYAYKTGLLDCTSASDIMGDMAKDLNLKVGYYNFRMGKIYDYLNAAVGASDGHICNMIMLNGQWVEYDAQPPH